jgi:EAL domain-containing protein (putative c-di-GMP-specific phosphodiesterase class I)/CheY-like chemotaxis protein
LISISSKYQATILIVESDPSVARTLSGLLSTKGYKVVIASLGQEAIEKTTELIDLIVLDMVLSDMDGIELCHYLKNSKDTSEIPIIILNGDSGRYREKSQCLQLGADDFINEPYEGQELFARIEKLMEKYPAGHPNSPRRGERLQELKRILAGNLVEPYFQPIYLLNSPELLGVEVLSRPQTDGPLRNPELLFATALEFGLYFDLEMMVWKKALEAFKKSGEDHKMFLNCSPYLVENDNFMQVEGLFQSSVVSTSSAFLELTERTAILEHKVFYDRLRQYRSGGFKIAVDDVGSGYSSLESIVETHPEVVKIDRSIVHALVDDPYKSSIVKFIVSFCHEHDIICVAEGVETKEELHIIKNLGVQACQGYYFCRPMPQLNIPAFKSVII